jgi:tetratricopeptide (TPR) repeat protein
MPQLLVLGLCIAVASRFVQDNAFIVGGCVYIGLSFCLRYSMSGAHRRGMNHFKLGDYAAAIPEFEVSYEFFSRHLWIDRYRFLTLLSSSRISYREMALANQAYCYGQIGEGEQARVLYEKANAEFPDREIAKAALRLMDAAGSDAE